MLREKQRKYGASCAERERETEREGGAPYVVEIERVREGGASYVEIERECNTALHCHD